MKRREYRREWRSRAFLVLHGVPSSHIAGMLGNLFWVWGEEEDTC